MRKTRAKSVPLIAKDRETTVAVDLLKEELYMGKTIEQLQEEEMSQKMTEIDELCQKIRSLLPFPLLDIETQEVQEDVRSFVFCIGKRVS